MKNFILTLILAFISVPALAQEPSHALDSWLRPVDAEYVCMVNDKSFDSPQIAVAVEDKTYYGCCAMCKGRLENDPTVRAAIDPVSGNTVNKAEAVIGAGPDHTVYYFENAENLQSYASSPMPEAHEQGSMEGMKGDMMHDNMDGMHGHGGDDAGSE